MEELTEEQVEELEDRLRELLQELQGQIETARDGSRPVDLDEPIGRLSRMDAMQQQQMTKAHRRRIELRLKQTQAALGRVDRGEYGDCVFCEEPIGYKRLSVRPESPMCLVCQSEREQ